MLAIDFGTSRVKVAYIQNGEAILAPLGVGGQSFIPSLFYISREGEVDIGDDAAAWLSDDPKGVVETLKRKLRENFIRKNRQKKKPQELIRKLFTQIRDRCHDELEHIFSEPPTAVTLTYPARYSDVEKNILRSAAREAGFTDINLISEPEAAALAWQHKAGRLSSDVLVVLDCGGGTADWACLKVNDGKLRLFSELPPGGDENIGGHDIDEELLTLVRDHFEDEDNNDAIMELNEKKTDILNQLRSIKEKYSRRGRLTSADVVRVGRNKVAITQEMLDGAFESKIIRDLVTNFSQYLSQVKEHSGEDNPIVLLVGGTGQLRGLPEALTERCNVSVKKWMESEFATVQGALYWNADITASAPVDTMQSAVEAQNEETQRLQEEQRIAEEAAHRAAEEAARLEQQKAEAARLAEDVKRAADEKEKKRREEKAKKAEELRQAEEKRKAEEARLADEQRKKQEAEEQAQKKQVAVSQNPQNEQQNTQKTSQSAAPGATAAVTLIRIFVLFCLVMGLCLVLIFGYFMCASSPEQSASQIDEPAVGEPTAWEEPPSNDAYDIRATVNKVYQGWERLDYEWYMSAWSRDMVYKGKSSAIGYNEFRRKRKKVFKKYRSVEVYWDCEEPVVQGKSAHIYCTYTMYYVFNSGRKTNEKNIREVYLLKKEGSDWKITENRDYL